MLESLYLAKIYHTRDQTAFDLADSIPDMMMKKGYDQINPA